MICFLNILSRTITEKGISQVDQAIRPDLFSDVIGMSRSFDLKPGEWTTVEGDLMPGSIDWRRVQVDEAFRKDIRKIDIRVYSNNKPAYTGPIYIDNVRGVK